jgi:serine/threonine protein kinase
VCREHSPACQAVAAQLISALAILLNAGWLHLDVKPGNILYCPQTRTVQLVDFSLSERYPLPEKAAIRSSYVTPIYRPPELFSEAGCVQDLRGKLCPGVDIWSTACCIFEVLAGQRLVKAPDEELLNYRGPVKGTLIGSRVMRLPPKWQGLFMRCLSKRAQDRGQPMVDGAAWLRLNGVLKYLQ